MRPTRYFAYRRYEYVYSGWLGALGCTFLLQLHLQFLCWPCWYGMLALRMLIQALPVPRVLPRLLQLRVVLWFV